MDAIGKEVRKFIARYQSIFDSFNDRFPLTTDDMITLSKMGVTAFTAREFIEQQTRHLQNLNKDIAANWLGQGSPSVNPVPSGVLGDGWPYYDELDKDGNPVYHGGIDIKAPKGLFTRICKKTLLPYKLEIE